jgi:quercetin dioxygenase-like cupin family protein
VLVFNLKELGEINPKQYLLGEWASVKLVTLKPGSATKYSTPNAERIIYVTDGAGVLRLRSEKVSLTRGTAVTLLEGEVGEVVAADSTLEYFTISFQIRDRNPGGTRPKAKRA